MNYTLKDVHEAQVELQKGNLQVQVSIDPAARKGAGAKFTITRVGRFNEAFTEERLQDVDDRYAEGLEGYWREKLRIMEQNAKTDEAARSAPWHDPMKATMDEAKFVRMLGREYTQAGADAIMASYLLTKEQKDLLRTRIRPVHKLGQAEPVSYTKPSEFTPAKLDAAERFLNRAGAVAAVILSTISAIIAATIASAAFAFCGVPVGLTVSWIIGGTYGLLRLRKALVALPGMVKETMARKVS